ncbi:MAG: hypothetical protein LBB76_05045, partial [Azoarcus sp.]|nr:hypothetical protein [Azoarcus sp.]
SAEARASDAHSGPTTQGAPRARSSGPMPTGASNGSLTVSLPTSMAWQLDRLSGLRQACWAFRFTTRYPDFSELSQTLWQDAYDSAMDISTRTASGKTAEASLKIVR